MLPHPSVSTCPVSSGRTVCPLPTCPRLPAVHPSTAQRVSLHAHSPAARPSTAQLPHAYNSPHRRHRDVHAQAFKWLQDLVHSGTPNDGNSTLTSKLSGAPKRDFLEARQVSLFHLFDGQEYQFDVPHYQRPYSWQTKHVFEMLQDFMAAYQSRNEYFLGAIVTTRTGDGSSPLQVIDGQQRLTTLLIILACVMDWASRQGNHVLEQRVRRMLYLEADPLDAQSVGRYRLKLRSSDNVFFERNVLQQYLPVAYHLAGVPASVRVGQSAHAHTHGAMSEQAIGAETSYSVPLENEAWWRIYENAAFVRTFLELQVAQGLSPQDFAFHVLRSCHVVLMNARDEETSFRIFSTLNSRGMDLTMVDKLKADLLQVMNPSQRREYADAWTEMEDVLGRDTFHRVFDYMKDLASSSDPQAANQTVLEYFTSRVRDSKSVGSFIEVALDYARIMLQLRQCRWEVLGLFSPRGGVGSLEPMLAEDAATGAFTTTLDEGGPTSEHTTHGAIRGLERQSRHMNLFHDDVWLPAMLQFFLVVHDVRARTRFLQAAEALQLYLELCCDVSERAARWRRVCCVLRDHDAGSSSSRPITSSTSSDDTLVQDVMAAMVLSRRERQEFRMKLEHKDLLSLVETRTIAHLLLRAEGAAVSSNPSLDFRQLRVERIMPPSPPEKSMWRRNKLAWPASAPAAASTAAAAAGLQGYASSPQPGGEGGGAELVGAAAQGAARSQQQQQQQQVQLGYQVNGQVKQRAHNGYSAHWGEHSAHKNGTHHHQAFSSGQAGAEAVAIDRSASSSGSGSSSGSSNGSSNGSHHSSSSSSSSNNGSGSGASKRGRKSRSGSGDRGQAAGSSSSSSSPGVTVNGVQVLQQPQQQQQQQQRRNSPTPEGGGFKYWFEVQRMFWHSKLGNLVLLPAASPPEVAYADFDVKAEFYRQCGVEALLPEFSGSLVRGRFSQQRFSFEECKARHAEIVQRLSEEFQLDADDEELLDFDDSEDEYSSDYED